MSIQRGTPELGMPGAVNRDSRGRQSFTLGEAEQFSVSLRRNVYLITRQERLKRPHLRSHDPQMLRDAHSLPASPPHQDTTPPRTLRATFSTRTPMCRSAWFPQVGDMAHI